MSGAFSLVREFILVYMASIGKPVDPNGVLTIFGHVAAATFIVSALVLLYSLHAENAKLREISVSPPSQPFPSVPAPNAPRLPAPVQDAATIPGPNKVYVRETKPSEVTKRLKASRWNERQAIAKESYIGFWVRWSGKISSVIPHGDGGEGGFTVSVWSDESVEPFVNMRFSASERHTVLQLERGQVIDYEAQIYEASHIELLVENVTVTRIAPSG